MQRYRSRRQLRRAARSRQQPLRLRWARDVRCEHRRSRSPGAELDPVIAAFFDMDNTLLTVDSGISWTRFLYRRGELAPAMLAKVAYWSTLYKLAVLDMERVFSRLVEDLAGDSEAEMIAKCAIWYRQDIAPFV